MPFELAAPWDRALPAVLVGVGALLALGSVLLARVSRYRAPHADRPDDPLADFHPRSIEEVEAERPRRWPALTAFVGIVLVASGLVTAQANPATEETLPAPSRIAEPYLVDVQVAAAPTPTPTPTPTPSPTPSPTPHTHPATPAPAPGSSGGSPGSPGASEGSAPATAATPAPRPGPVVQAGASCAGDTATLDYQVAARGGTTLSTLEVILDGRVDHRPGVNGSARHQGQYQQVRMSPGGHQFAITTTGSDGGRTHGHYPFTC